MGNRMYVPREIENNDYEFIHSFRWREGGRGGVVVGTLATNVGGGQYSMFYMLKFRR